MKSIYKAVTLTVSSMFMLAQFGCSTPATSNPSVVPSANTTTNNNNTVVNTKMNSFLITQKNSAGVVNPVVPEDLKSVTINGKVYDVSQISITKGAFSTKADGELKLSFRDGKFYLEGVTDINSVSIAFNFKDTEVPLYLPNSTLAKFTGDIRLEITTNEAGDITHVSGGVNKDGALDPAGPVFNFDVSAKEFKVTQPTGEQTTYQVDNTTVSPNVEQTTLTPEQTQEEINGTSTGITDPGPATPFVGKWKYTALGYTLTLDLEDAGSSKMNFVSEFQNVATNLKSTYTGNVAYTTETDVNVLNLAAKTIDNKTLKGKVERTGDNSIVFTLTESDSPETMAFLNVPMNLERDVM